MKPLILVGGGGHCKSVIEAAESCGITILGVLDLPEMIGKEILGHRIIGSDDDICKFTDKAEFVVTVGHIKDSSLREKIHNKIKTEGGVLATIVASSANVSKYAQLGAGSVVLHGAMVNSATIIGEGVIINTLSNIEHDAEIGDFCHISTGAMVNGNCKVGRSTFIGSQSVMLNGIEICDGCVVAAGSFVRKSINIKGIYAGNPAILMKKI